MSTCQADCQADYVRVTNARAPSLPLAVSWDGAGHHHVPPCASRQKPTKEPPGGIFTEPHDHGLGRSRGGFTTKLHLAVEQGQKPVSIVVTAGQRGDSPQFEPMLEKVRVPRFGPGRPRLRPDRVRADQAYASRGNRAHPHRRGIRCTIPDKADQARNRRKRGSRGGRPPCFDPVDYRERHAVECASGWGRPRAGPLPGGCV